MAQTCFYKAIEAVYSGWTALQLAISHSFGGSHSKEKGLWFISATEQWFNENADLDPVELEEFLEEVMSAEFNSVVDDNSLTEVANKICSFHQLLLDGKTEEFNSRLSTLRKSANVSTSQRQHADSDEDDDEMDAEMSIQEQNMVNHLHSLDLHNRLQPVTEVPCADNSPSLSSELGKDSQSEGMQQDGEEEWTVVPSRRSGKKK